MVWLPDGDISVRIHHTCNRFDRIPAGDGRTDKLASCDGIVRAMHTRRTVKKSVRIVPVRDDNDVDESQTQVVYQI